VPEDADLAPWVPEVPHWEELSEPDRRAACTLMELYAAFAEHTDVQVGRLVDALSAMGELENTLVFYILGDNGAAPGGGRIGTINEHCGRNGLEVTGEEILAKAETLGGPETWPQYAVGWALAMDVPVDEAGRVALRRQAQRAHSALAGGDPGVWRAAPPMASRDRHRADDPGGGWAARSPLRRRSRTATGGGDSDELLVRRRRCY